MKRSRQVAVAAVGCSLMAALGACEPARGVQRVQLQDSGVIGLEAQPAADGGFDGGATIVFATIGEARAARFPARVALRGVVVTAVFNNNEATSGSCAKTSPKGWYAAFWVADPSRPTDAVFVSKHCSDLPLDLQVAVGDVIDVDGFIGAEKNFVDREGYRTVVKSQYDFLPAAQRPGELLVVAQRGTMAPVGDVEVAAGFGDAKGGTEKADRQLAGVRVHIPGPLHLVSSEPTALRRSGGAPDKKVIYGFEVTGGVLVNDYKTYKSFGDGGLPACDWRSMATDGGTVLFPEGIRGVWDTFTHAPCEDGGTASNCRRGRGSVPGVPDANFTYVLYPMDCATDLPGVVEPSP